MKIKVKGYLTLKNAIDDKAAVEVEAEKVTLRDLLADLANTSGARFRELIFDPKTKELSGHVRVLVNGRHHKYLSKGLDSELKDGDEVALFPPMAGG